VTPGRVRWRYRAPPREPPRLPDGLVFDFRHRKVWTDNREVRMNVKPAKVMASDLGNFLQKATDAIARIEAFKERLETDPDFQALWEADSAKALLAMGIDPDARMEVGGEPYVMGPRCDWCVTPNGNACHC
jgi:hypothetical protein